MKKLLILVALFAAVSAEAMNTQGGIQRLMGPSGQQISCKANQQVYVGSNGKVRCVKKGLLGSSKKPSLVGPGGVQRLVGPNGKQIKCKSGQQVYVGSHGAVSCIAKGSLGSSRN